MSGRLSIVPKTNTMRKNSVFNLISNRKSMSDNLDNDSDDDNNNSRYL